MNHSQFEIKPLENLMSDYRSGDIVTLFFPHTKLTGHICTNTPWGSSTVDILSEGDDLLFGLHSTEGSSDGLKMKFPKFGVNTKEETISCINRMYEYAVNEEKIIKEKLLGYSIIQRHWDYNIFINEPNQIGHNTIPDWVHCGGGNGTHPLEGEASNGNYIKGALIQTHNDSPAGGILTYSSDKKTIDRIIRLVAPYEASKLAREYFGQNVSFEKELPFTQDSIQNIIDKKIPLDIEDKKFLVDIVQL